MYFVVIYAVFFGVNFILQKFCSCKKNDKHEGDDGAWVEHHEVDDHVEDHYDHL